MIVLVGIVGVFGFWVWGMVDAYQGARRWNAAHGSSAARFRSRDGATGGDWRWRDETSSASSSATATRG